MPRKLNPRCAKCRYHADENSPHNCDYLWITGNSRTHQVRSKRDLAPARCPLFKPMADGGRPKSINNWK